MKLSELLKYNLQSVRSHLLREDFQRFWEYTSPGWAVKFLDQWCTRTMRSKIEPMKKIARSLAGASRLNPQLVPGQRDRFRRVRRGSEQQSETDDQKSLWFSHLRSHRNRPISHTWQPSRAKVHPRILLTRHLAGNLSQHAFLYSNGTMTDLGTLSGYSRSMVYDINTAGQTVGYCSNPGSSAYRECLYSQEAIHRSGHSWWNFQSGLGRKCQRASCGRC